MAFPSFDTAGFCFCAAVFACAFTNVDVVHWGFHFYVLLQPCLTLCALHCLLSAERRGQRPWAAYGLALLQIYLYEPGILVPGIFFAVELIRFCKSRERGAALRQAAAMMLGSYAVQLRLRSFWSLRTSTAPGAMSGRLA